MEASCTSCPARFAVPDDKVRGRKVRIACKRCGAPIIVDGTTLGPATKPAAAPGATAAKPSPAAAAPKPAVTAPKPAAPAAPKPAVTAPAAAPKAALPAAAPKPAAVGAATKPASTAAAAAPKPSPGVSAPKPAVGPAAKAPAAPAPIPKPGGAAAPKAAASADDNDWSALSESGGKTGTWREPASAAPPPSSVPRPGVAGPPRVGGFAKRTMLGGLEAPRGAAPAPPVTDRLGSAARPASVPKPEPEQEEPSDAEPEWTVALTDDQHEEMRTAEVVQLYARGSIDQETFIWADGMEDWKRPWEIPMIAAALSARGLKPKSESRESDLPMDEPAEEDATIVASMGALMPPSSRAKVPSGVWHEPGRDEEDKEIGFEDVTVSIDSRSAQDLLSSLGSARAPQKSKPELLAEQFDDAPTRVHDEAEAPPPSTGTHDVDDLLSDMEERTLAMEDAFRADSRPMSAADLLGDDDDTTIAEAQRAAGGFALPSAALAPSPTGDSFSLENLMAGTGPAAQPPNQDLFAGVDFAPPPAGRDRPLDSLWEPTSIQQASSPTASPAGISGPYPAAGPMSGPMPLPHAPAKRKSRFGCVLVLLLLLLVVGGGAAASFFLKQPASLYGPDGMPKIPGLTR